LLITKKGASERVKEVVEHLKRDSVTSATQHPFEVRPWGRFEIMSDGVDFKSKTITVDPGQQLSYQSHAQRAEHWIIVKGGGEVVLNDQVIAVHAGKHVHIPTGAKHRIRNTGATPLQFVEVQLGSYFGEDDIVRYQDDYNRTQSR
jgi:mannose-1-phosphate guanylyltransferase/mannose-1-phosphate guanylyltransferase/mannose-6-phosphate isomerase